MTQRRAQTSMIVIFLTPALLAYLVFFIAPAVQAFFYSLLDWNGFTVTKKFVGLANFRELLSDPYFWKVVLKNSFLIAIVGGVAIFTFAFLLAGILAAPVKGKAFFKNLIFFPSLLNPVAVAILWANIYNPKLGLLNGILKLLGVVNLPIWTAPDRLFWAILVAMVWMYTGYYFIIMLSALERIPVEVSESARLEGANEITIFFRIKLPLIVDAIRVMAVFWGISAIREFSLFYAWGGGIDVPQASVQNIATYLQFVAFGKRVAMYRMGYGAAIGIMCLFCTVLLILLVNRIFQNRKVEY